MELKGLYQDDNAVNASFGTWTYAKNLLINEGFKSVSNENGFDLSLTAALPIICALNVNVGYVLFLTDNRRSAITFVNNSNVSVDVIASETTLLKFSFEFPIEAVYKINNLGQIIVAWVDNNNEPRVINITQVIADGGTVTSVSLFPDNPPSIIEETVVDNGGSLLSGAYYITSKKTTTYGITTQYEILRQPLHITDDSEGVGHNNLDGCIAGTITNKSIALNITHNGSTIFNKITIGVVTKINNVLTFYEQGEYSIVNGVALELVITDLSSSPVLDISEVLINTPVYTKAKTIETLNDNLYLGNLSNPSRLDYQKYANNIKLGWTVRFRNVTTLSSAGSSKQQAGNHDYKTFMPREVYNFYIFFYLNKGGISELYHIPGSPLVAGDRVVSALTNTGFSTNPMKYQVEDRGVTSLGYSDIATGTGFGTGTMGVWENQTQQYLKADALDTSTEVWDSSGQLAGAAGSIEGQNVRFHKMPSSKWFADTGYEAEYGKTVKEVLGINWEDVYIPDEIKSQIKGYGFAYAKRDSENITIYGNDYLQYLSRETLGGWEFSSGVNNAFNGAVNNYTILPQHSASNCLDLLKSKLAISPDAIINEYLLKFTHGTALDINPGVSPDAIAIDYTTAISGVGDTNVISSSGTNKALKKVSNFQYIPNDVKLRFGGIDLLHYNKQEVIYFKIADNNNVLPSTTDMTPGGGAGDIILTDTASSYYSFLALKTNIYQNYKSINNFCLSDVLIDKNETDSSNVTDAAIFFGDCFTCMASHIQHNFVRDNTYPSTVSAMRSAGVQFIAYNYVLISANNWGLRHELQENQLTKYFPKTLQSGLLTSINPGYYQWLNEYNQDYSSLNDLLVGTAYNYENNVQNKFPFKIVIGENKGSDNDFSINWASFLPNNFYNMLERNKGEIWKIIKYKNHLLIHQKFSLFIALLKDKLITSTQEVYLGTGDIFDRKPDEIIYDTQGYTGNQSQFASIVCKLGYCFLDKSTGKVFIFNGELKEISNYGNRKFFRDNLQTAFGNLTGFTDLPDTDNPYLYNGLILTYDEKNNRLILGKKSLVPTFAYSTTFSTTTNYNVNLYFYYKGGFYKVTAGSPTGYYLTSTALTAATKYLALVDFNDTSLFTNKSFTFSYSPIINEGKGGWVSFHDYFPNILFYTRLGNYAVRNGLTGGLVYTMNSLTKKGMFFLGTVYKTYIDYIFNSNTNVAKNFNCVMWDADVYDITDIYNKILEDKTLTHIMIYNNNQCSDVISLVRSPYLKKNMRNVKEKWFFNEFRDLVKNKDIAFLDNDKQVISNTLSTSKAWFNKNLFLSKYVIIRFQYDNVVQNHININEVNTNIKIIQNG